MSMGMISEWKGGKKMNKDSYFLLKPGSRVELIGKAKTCGQKAVVVELKETSIKWQFKARIKIKYDLDGEERWISYTYLKIVD